jgi:hypothetical protein
LNSVRNRIEIAAREGVSRLGEGYAPSIELRVVSMSSMDTYIRCGVESVYDGQRIDTPFLISAVGDEIDGEWVPFDRAVEKLVELYRHHVLFRDSKWLSKNGQIGGTIVSRMYLKYLQHVRGAPGGGYDLHARMN